MKEKTLRIANDHINFRFLGENHSDHWLVYYLTKPNFTVTALVQFEAELLQTYPKAAVELYDGNLWITIPR